MAENSGIQWTHHTFNPWRGCSKVHTGCTNCYAEVNYSVKMHGIKWGTQAQGGTRVRLSGN
jgi:protein gp37